MWLPLGPKVTPPCVHDVAFELLHDHVAVLPAAIVEGDTEKLIVGAGGVETVTVALREMPAQTSVYVVVDAGLTVVLPLVGIGEPL